MIEAMGSFSQKRIEKNRARKLVLILWNNLAILALVLALGAISQAHAAKLTKSQIESLQTNIQNSKNMSDKCAQLQGNAQENLAIATTNFEKTKTPGYRQAAETLRNANSKLIEARKHFDDAWIAKQYGLEHGELTAVEEGVKIHNTGVQYYNDGVQLLTNAGKVFEQAFQQRKNYSGTNTATSNSGAQSANSKITWSMPGLPVGGGQDTFPIVAVIILIGTVITSLQAFSNHELFEKYVLHPWSIANHKKRYYTLLSCGLIHADPFHLMMNMMSFCFFGLILETIIGHARFLLVYIGSLLFGSLALTATNRNNAFYRAVGASGAITGVICSYIIYRANPNGLHQQLFIEHFSILN